jgi:hypothetical protein
MLWLMLGNLITPRVQKWLRNGRPACILHLFDEVCNLVNDQNDVLSLVSPQIGPGPFTMVLDTDFTAGLAVDQPVSVDSARQTLTIGSLVVEFEETAVWQPKPNWKQLQNIDATYWPSPDKLSPDINPYLLLVIDGIAHNDMAACRAGVYGLAGRGGGLTPTGDDVLLGVLYGLWVWYPRRDWLGMIVETAVPRTTTLSANFIRAAAAGEAVWQWHDLANGRTDAISNILAIGHTSGTDTWAGFWHTYMTLCPNRG